MSRRRPRVGDVIQVTLPTGRYAYGRVLQDASVAFYSGATAEPGLPPIDSRDYQVVVGVYDDVPSSEGAPVIGRTVQGMAPYPGQARCLALGCWQSAFGGSMSRVAEGHFRRKREAPLILRGSTSQCRGHPRT
jgi:hypothetical protein